MSAKSPSHRLLIVDDSRLIRRMISDFFRSRGFDVEMAADGVQALRRIEERVPDVIVSDILMPEMDGWELFEQVRARDGCSDVPFVFLSTETKLPERLRGLQLGADDYMTKPFAVEELLVRVQRALDRRVTAPSAGGQMLAGSVRHLPLHDLLQILGVNGSHACVSLTQGGQTGKIFLDGGRIVQAETGRAAGKKALYRLIGWTSARFSVTEEAPTGARTLDLRPSDALMDAMVALDEWRRYESDMPPPGTRLTFQDDARSRLRDHKVSATEFDVMSQCKRGASVADILDGLSVPDGELAKTIVELIKRGVLSANA